jgi:tetratricopeptide (TPR) repeat protein
MGIICRKTQVNLLICIAGLLLVPILLIGQPVTKPGNTLFNNLPLGKYAVGYKITSLNDESRVVKPEYNYFGEKETGSRFRKITMHIWYPAKANTGTGGLTYEDYACYHHKSYTEEEILPATKQAAINGQRNGFENFFGKITDEQWGQVKNSTFIAQKNAEPLKEKFPLLVGMLRPLSTSVTNELMASNGYVVIMILAANLKLPSGYLSDVDDMGQAVVYAGKNFNIEDDNIGTYGFSGSGFSQLLFAMNNFRVKAHADIESGYYGDGLWELLSASNLFEFSKFTVPFLHIYSKELAKQDKHFKQFYNKKYSQRYHLLLNQSGQHHWDVATEGRASNTILHMRGAKEPGLNAGFELSNIYLLNFFNSVLKKDSKATEFLKSKPALKDYPDSIWSIKEYPALPVPPNRQDFAELIRRKGINTALETARQYFSADAVPEFISDNALFTTARDMLSENKNAEAVELLEYAIQIYPDKAWLFHRFAEIQENLGHKEQAIILAEKLIQLLANDKSDESSFNQRMLKWAKERIERLKPR